MNNYTRIYTVDENIFLNITEAIAHVFTIGENRKIESSFNGHTKQINCYPNNGRDLTQETKRILGRYFCRCEK